MSKPCFLRDGCPSKSGACSSLLPNDDGCPVFRYFRDMVKFKDPIQPTIRFNDKGFKYAYCGSCGEELCTGKPKFCCECGRAVKWDA